MPTSTLTSKGQVTIPIEIRTELGLKPGDKVSFRKRGNELVLEPSANVVDRLVGMLHSYSGGGPPATLEQWDEAAAAGIAREPLIPEE